jgi:hypothetical protein
MELEVLVGFAVGFLAGSKEGRQGLARILEAADAIRSSKEVQKLVENALAIGMPAMKELTRAARV